MGKLHRIIKRSAMGISAVLLAAAVAAVPLSDNIFTYYVGAIDYDSEIKKLEEEAERIKEENEQRELEIGSLTGDISANEQAMDTINAQIDGIQEEIQTYGQLITAKQEAINKKKIDIVDVENSIAVKEVEIENKEARISDLEVENEANLEKFAMLIRVLYMNDTSDTLPILEGSDDWYDFFVYQDVVQNISSRNLEFVNDLKDAIKEQENLIIELNNDINQLANDKKELEEQKKELEADLAALQQEKTDLQAHADERYSTLAEYAAYNESLENRVTNLRGQISATAEQMDEIDAEIEKLIREKQLANSGGPVYSSDGFRWPLDSKYTYITTYFGYDAWRGGNHRGIDVGNGGIGGANIYAAQGGTVILAYNDSGWNGGYGNYVIIDHGGGLSTLYAHCYSTTVVAGQTVNKGDIIGYVGTTGWSTGNHLHFETRVNGTAVDPFSYGYEYV